ncbi:hypothetical protein BD410DRAFT_722675 [Rickenella mellea]|uniref:Uncharacterized protein n=1 Tax=Rickenella mellea TaxID=50990 RepID=A0A4Y7Q5K7_9AGAM|nr:hypothetical protein BD410DRAFT_722675 [Rickenella mellea]
MSCVLSVTAYGTINAPANGTAIAPGASFDFSYSVHADYCVSSYNFTVWLFTTPVKNILAGTATGYLFGRFSEENYPANPFPSNPVPSKLTMPDLSQSSGGFGTGLSKSNAPVHLVVIEEWSSCTATFGNHLTIATADLVYNATKKN